MLKNADDIVRRLKSFQATVRSLLIESRKSKDLHAVNRSSTADTIYQIDTVVEPVLVEFCKEWSKTTPLVLIAEGLEDESGKEVEHLTFPLGSRQEDAEIRVIVDPIDGTRGIMYDKRSAWALAGVAPNKGPGTRLRDIEVAVMTELPTSKMGLADVLWAVKGNGAVAERVDLRSGVAEPLAFHPSQADGIAHGFAMVVNFFPGTKVIAGELMERIASELLGGTDTNNSLVFDDQYISTGGQFYEAIVGHDRFNADLRPYYYRIAGKPEGLCCHPYDCATLLIAEEAGVIVTDGLGRPLDGPLDTTTGLAWAVYANATLQRKIEPLLTRFLGERGVR
ncbi:FIG domain-containing protein [Humisphaera borealis]|uniref:Inositol monophosphatase n=1 Tax=Humisphaera borealis TaxID=2807512 RepID=A0A7M2X1N0_9BACT|nr:inositol monophosphatase family protein [Humisphaera borealis]QOV91352.1 inositol monophosphatase [Humisphaera borealis]